jgi:DUF1365 family protein
VSNSAIYEGWVRHRRIEPVRHSFRYRVFMTLLDLDELPELFDRHPLYSARRPAPARFRRSDYLGDPDVPLAEAARLLVAERTGRRPRGPVRLLTHLRYLGRSFNPVSFYYLYDRAAERVEAVIAEVTNIPWRERHAYVVEQRGPGPIRGRMAKRLHVSPFMPMEQEYEWRITEPGEALGVGIANLERGRRVFDATLAMGRRELSAASMTKVLATYPPMSLAVPARIYANALRLKLKGARFHAHPQAAGRSRHHSHGSTPRVADP